MFQQSEKPGTAKKGKQMTTKYATQGNGTAIHIAVEVTREDGAVYNTATKCDAWGSLGGQYVRKGRVRLVQAEAATCKRCLKASN
jgi:hypothetical protein